MSTTTHLNQRPATLRLNPAGIPAEMKLLVQWVNWRWARTDDGHWTKVPIDSHTGALASSTNPTSRSSFTAVLARVERGDVDGLGFVFTNDDPYVGIDLDKVIEPDTGVIDAEAKGIIDNFGSYTEISPSGTGIHIIVKGRLPEGVTGRRQGHIELYQSGRYFTMTGHRLWGDSDGR
ncbi:MAG: hypothetical protein H0W06_00430 [Chloroflexia bacterium]|nr:hypothetical protein [Chloroflexia bacterium]